MPRGGRRDGAGRPKGSPDRVWAPGVVEERTTRREFKRTETVAKRLILDALKSVAGSPFPRWFQTMVAMEGVDKIEVQKKILGKYVPVTEVAPGDVDAANVTDYVKGWGAAEYNFRVIHEGDYVGSGRTFVIGGEEGVMRSEPTARGFAGTLEDVDSALAQTTKRITAVSTLRELQRLNTEGNGDDDMKAEQLMALAAAMKPEKTDLTPLVNIVQAGAQAAEARASSAEQRNHELQMKMMDMLEGKNGQGVEAGASVLTALAPVLEFLKPLVSPTLIRTLFGKFFAEPPPTGGWTPDGIVNALSGLGPMLAPFVPALASMVQNAIAQANTSPAPTAPAPAAALPAPPPQPNGGDTLANPVIDALVAEFRKPKDDLDCPGISAFLDSILLPNGTALDLFGTLAATPENLAKVSLGQRDARFIDAQTWPGVAHLLKYLREAEATAKAKAEERGEGVGDGDE